MDIKVLLPNPPLGKKLLVANSNRRQDVPLPEQDHHRERPPLHRPTQTQGTRSQGCRGDQ